MRRVSLLLLCASLALAADPPFFNLQLTVDASRRYLVYGQMVSIHTPFSLNPPDLVTPRQGSTQNFNFALTTGTPYLTVAGVGCTDCSNVPA